MENSTGKNAQNADDEQPASTTFNGHMDVDATLPEVLTNPEGISTIIFRKSTALSTDIAGGQRENFSFAKWLVLIILSSQELFSAVLSVCMMGLLQKSVMSAATTDSKSVISADTTDSLYISAMTLVIKDLAQHLVMVGLQVSQRSTYRLHKSDRQYLKPLDINLLASTPWEISFQVTFNHAKMHLLAVSARDMRHSWKYSYCLTELLILPGKCLALAKNLAHLCSFQTSVICCYQHYSLECAIGAVTEDYS